MVGGERAPLCLWTVGHSTRTVAELIALLREARIEQVVDVRRYPVSRRNPQFVKEALASGLASAGIQYRHEIDLGGMREPRPGSRNLGLRNEAFRGYADHMRTEEFEKAFERLLDEAGGVPTAVLCAEAEPASCHRRLLSDLVVLSGWGELVHLIAPGRSEAHVLHANATLDARGRILYPKSQQSELDF